MRYSNDNERYMAEALRQAKKAAMIEEVPIGCVIVHENKIIARGYNRRNKDASTLAHAEIIAIKKASKKLGDWRLEECTMYVTLEPCPMCAGAILQSRIKKVIYGAKDPKGGCIDSCMKMYETKGFNHYPEVLSGILDEECASLLTNFFRKKRALKKQNKIQKSL